MQAYLPKPAVIVVIHSAVKASAKCLTGHPRTKEKQGWVTSQRMRCDALGTSSAVRTRLQCAVTFAQIKKLQAYVTETISFIHDEILFFLFSSHND